MPTTRPSSASKNTFPPTPSHQLPSPNIPTAPRSNHFGSEWNHEWKYFLLVLHFRTLYTLPQIVSIMQQKFNRLVTPASIQEQLAFMYESGDELYFRVRETGKVEYAWFPKIEEVKEAEEIEIFLRREGRWLGD
ncbi:MAG: hypothetical protein Q9166_004607 [cf. Caloplaca sp. 2 TL-2023]